MPCLPPGFGERQASFHGRREIRAVVDDTKCPHLVEALEHRVQELDDGGEKTAIDLFGVGLLSAGLGTTG